MSIRYRLLYFHVQVFPGLVVASVLIWANMQTNYDPSMGIYYHGFPVIYDFSGYYDATGMVADIGVGICLVLVTLVASFFIRKKTLDILIRDGKK